MNLRPPARCSAPALLVLPLFLAGCASAPFRPSTTLTDPGRTYSVVPEGRAEIVWGNPAEGAYHAVLADNRAFGAVHKTGYGGLAEIRRDGPEKDPFTPVEKGSSPFVPAYSGLNLEHVLDGTRSEDRAIQFEPRNHPMELRRVNEHSYELYQAPLPTTGLETCQRFDFTEPGVIDVTIEAIPRKDSHPNGYLALFFASYIEKPSDPGIYFLGRLKGDIQEDWIRIESPKHGEAATTRSAMDRFEERREEPFPLTLVFNETDKEHVRPFFYGSRKKFMLLHMFRKDDLPRFTMSPSGGGEKNPAWDFQFFIRNPVKDRPYQFKYRFAHLPWTGPGEAVKLYEKFRREVR